MLAGELDPRLNLLKSLDIPACRVEYLQAPIVLLCGGKVKSKTTPEGLDPQVKSLRHAITKLHTEYEVFRPEEIDSWQSDAIFKDLMRFELELAAICSLVVIILESEGAIAELGAFSQVSQLSEKIIAICPEEFRNANSFINLGILRFIAAKNDSNVKSYPWTPDKEKFVVSDEVVGDVCADIQEELDKLPKSQLLKVGHDSHVMVLISELLRFFSALKESEISQYLAILGVEISIDSLRGKLFLLREFQLIKMQGYGGSDFYLSGKKSYHTLRLSILGLSKPTDLLRIQTECLEYYQNNRQHRNRLRAISQANAGAVR